MNREIHAITLRLTDGELRRVLKLQEEMKESLNIFLNRHSVLKMLVLSGLEHNIVVNGSV